MASWKKNKMVGVIAGIIFIVGVVFVISQVLEFTSSSKPNFVFVVQKGRAGRVENEKSIPYEKAKEKYDYTDRELREMDYTIVLEPNE